MRDGAPAAARVEGRDEGAARHHHARRRQGQDLRRKAEGVLATPAQVKPELQGDQSPRFLYCVALNLGVPLAGLALLQLATAQGG